VNRHPNAPDEPGLLQLKVPPHSREAEQSLLGGLLLDNEAFERVADLVGAEDFYQDDHRRIWRHISRLIEANKPADMLTVSDALEQSEDRDKYGGVSYLASLANNTPSSLNIRRYAELVRERSIQRRLATVGTEIADSALTPGGMDVDSLLDEAETKVMQISEGRARAGVGPVDIKPLISRVFEKVDHLYHQNNKSGITGVPTGFADLDDKTAGMHAGELVIVAGRPSMGKTAFAMNVAEHVAVVEKLPVAIFSMEMSGIQLAQRLLGSIGQVDQHKMRTGRLGDEEWSRLTEAMSKLHAAPISIDESGGLTGAELRARARRLKRRYGKLGLVVVDYLQLMEAKAKGENRATEVSEISRTLKAMAKELDCPVMALSQLSRKVEERPDRRPMMSDLRESGAIEQDADTILFLYRQVVYTPDMPDDVRNVAELNIGKQRNGPIGTVLLTFLGQHTRFANYANPGGTTYHAWRAPRAKKAVANFQDYKQQAAGPDAG
jgi:replicative DNA helicase